MASFRGSFSLRPSNIVRPLPRTTAYHESEGAALKKQVEARIQELTRTKAEVVRDSIEKSITDLGQRQKELEDKRLFADYAVRELESTVQNDGDAFSAYSRRIRKVLDMPAEGLKAGLLGLIAGLLLADTEIKVALSGVPLREPVRLLFASSPPEGLEPPT